MNALLRKIGHKKGMRSILVNAPPEALAVMDLQEDTTHKLTGSFDYIHLFVRDQEHLETSFPKLRGHLNPDGMLWVSWPKGKLLGTDLTLRKIIEIGYRHRLVESKTISIDSTWSAIKFTFPKEGKQYNNSYGKLGPQGASIETTKKSSHKRVRHSMPAFVKNALDERGLMDAYKARPAYLLLPLLSFSFSSPIRFLSFIRFHGHLGLAHYSLLPSESFSRRTPISFVTPSSL